MELMRADIRARGGTAEQIGVEPHGDDFFWRGQFNPGSLPEFLNGRARIWIGRNPFANAGSAHTTQTIPISAVASFGFRLLRLRTSRLVAHSSLPLLEWVLSVRSGHGILRRESWQCRLRIVWQDLSCIRHVGLVEFAVLLEDRGQEPSQPKTPGSDQVQIEIRHKGSRL
jgi:hypothetical protein